MTLLDNPGGGDCLFYAMSAGLIAAIKTLPEQQARDLWDNWASRGKLEGISFEAIRGIDLNTDPKRSNELKLALQHSLRDIAAQAMKEESEALFAEQYEPHSKGYKEKEKKVKELNEKLKEFDRLDKEVEEIKKRVQGDGILEQFDKRIIALRRNNGASGEINELISARTAYYNEQILNTEPARNLRKLQDNAEITEWRSQRKLLTSNRLEIDPVYRDFRLLVQFYQSNPSRTENNNQELGVNIFSDSPEIQELAKTVAKNTSQLKGATLDEHVIQVFCDPINRKRILAGVDPIKSNGNWGKTDHATAVLNTLGVNSHIEEQVGGTILQSKTNNSFGEGVPCVKLVNQNNKHWLTDVPGAALEKTVATSEDTGKQLASERQNSYSEINKRLQEQGMEPNTQSSLEQALRDAYRDEGSNFNAFLQSAKTKAGKESSLTDEELAAQLQEKELKGPSP